MLREEYLIKSTEQLREIFGHTSERIWTKSTNVLSDPMRKFIKLSPFCCICSHDKDGRADISPRGDAPGFVKIVDGSTLMIPDRPGNRRYDTFRNIFDVPQIAMIFMIPGALDTLRIAGTARVSHDPELLAQFPVDGKLPKIVTIITIEEAYGHCSKAIKRGKIWEEDHKIKAKDAPSLLEMMTAHLTLSNDILIETDEIIEQDAVNNMY